MSVEPGRSPVHRIVQVFADAMKGLSLSVPPLFVEKWGVAVHQALSSRAREFHTHQHVLSLVEGADPLETLAAMYHDIVYVQVDLDVPPHYASLLLPLIQRDESKPHGWRILPNAAVDPVASDVMAVFAHHVGQVLTPTTGLNEFASALVAGKEMEGVLTRDQLIAMAAGIEGTIPFRDDEGLELEFRLGKLGISAELMTEMVRRATRLSNSDVENFADPDPAHFLDNTWKLLPETNPALHVASTYGIRDYRVAMMKMEGFLSHLPPERVFHSWRGEPSEAEHRHRIEAARINMGFAVRYLRTKLYATTVIEALAVQTGGDVPIDYFMGGIPELQSGPLRRLEMYLPSATSSGDPVLERLLRFGRMTTSAFDISPSPIADFLYGAMGEERMMQGFGLAREFWADRVSALDFLLGQPGEPMAAVAEAASKIADLRSVQLQELAVRLKARPG
jgi:hypothetical protein